MPQPSHEVPDLISHSQGYRLLLRTEEVWKLLALRTQYCNWYTRLSPVMKRRFCAATHSRQSSLYKDDVDRGMNKN